MLKTVILARNSIDPTTWTKHEVKDVREFLMSEFEVFPDSARIYHKEVSAAHDVTPSDEIGVERLGELEGPFIVIVYPEGIDPITLIIIAVVVAVVAAVALAIFMAPPAMPTQRQNDTSSSNNELSARTNKARPNSRIPDIFGTVRSTPDLLALPYKVFVDNQEVEYAYMCIGRGAYDVSDIRDDTTPANTIDGMKVEVYGPNTSPNSGHSPQLRIGDPINTNVVSTRRCNAVNGQTCDPPDYKSLIGDSDVYFESPNKIKLTEGSTKSFLTSFENGVSISISGSSFDMIDGPRWQANHAYWHDGEGGPDRIFPTTIPASYNNQECIQNGTSGSNEPEFSDVINGQTNDGTTKWKCIANVFETQTYDLDGSYTIVSVAEKEIVLSNPSAVNANWSIIGDIPGNATAPGSPTLTAIVETWIGPFILDDPNLTGIICNFIAMGGLYGQDTQGNKYPIDVTMRFEATPVNNDNTPRGSVETWDITIVGDAYDHDLKAVTLRVTPTLTGRHSIKARRITGKSGLSSAVEEVKWRDCYSVAPSGKTHFGNVTTVQCVTLATTGALAVKERKLNMLVTRKIPQRISGSTFSSTLYPTNSADEIISAICLDQHIGGRQVSEIDFDSIYNAIDAINAYFGTSKASEFCYTFDKEDLSFEETISTIANAIFCTAYRRGNIIKLSPEMETEDSVLLFNHRNKLPGSETRTIRFGYLNDNDGIAYSYVDPSDDSVATYYIPEDQTAVNAKEVESIGVRSKIQAYFNAYRLWNKLRFQNVATEFTATQEADLLVRNDRILVADNTRPDTQDGEVLEQDVLLLTLSQSVTIASGIDYTIFLQHIDGTIESMGITAGPTSKQVVLERAPRLPLALDDDLYARCVYWIVSDTSTREQVFLVNEKKPQSNFTSQLTAINYDDRYYQNDSDYLNGIIDVDGNRI